VSLVAVFGDYSCLVFVVSLGLLCVVFSSCSSCKKRKEEQKQVLGFSTKQNANAFLGVFVCFLYIKEIKGSYK